MHKNIHAHYLNTDNLCQCPSLIRQYEAYLAKLFVEINSTWFSRHCAITTHCSHVHITADMTTMTQPHQLQTTASHSVNQPLL